MRRSRAGLDTPVQCVSVTPGDFDNDMDVDLYLACRTGASNLPNMLYENLGNGTFRRVAGAGGAAGPVGIAVASGAGTADSARRGGLQRRWLPGPVRDQRVQLATAAGSAVRTSCSATRAMASAGSRSTWSEPTRTATPSARGFMRPRMALRNCAYRTAAYHRWSQDLRRSHFGLAGATAVDLRVEWPSGAVQTFRARGHQRAVSNHRRQQASRRWRWALRQRIQCGPPPLNGAVDNGVFVWRDCPTGEWRLQDRRRWWQRGHTPARSLRQRTMCASKVSASTAQDQLNFTANPKQIVFRFDTRGAATDGANFQPREGTSTCMKVTAPSGSQVFYGPFRKPLTPPFDLNSQAPC